MRIPRLASRARAVYFAALTLAAALVVSACGGSSSTAEPSATAAATPTPQAEGAPSGPVARLRAGLPPLGVPPALDTSVASVEIEDVVFDTFRGRFVRLNEASDRTVESLRDAILPI